MPTVYRIGGQGEGPTIDTCILRVLAHSTGERYSINGCIGTCSADIAMLWMC